jgi:hypothetical protein
MERHGSDSHLSGREQNELRRIANKILDELSPLAIYYYGSHVTHQINRNYFSRNKKKEEWTTSYDLLIIADDQFLPDEVNSSMRLEHDIRPIAHTHIIIHRWGFIEDQLISGNFFFTWILRSAVKLYDRVHQFRQPAPPDSGNRFIDMHPDTHMGYKTYMAQSERHLVKAEGYLSKKASYDALEQLQYAMEYALKAAAKAAADYDFNTGDMERIITFLQGFLRLPSVFSTATREEHRLYTLMTRAKGSPDRLPQKVTPGEVSVLIERAKLLRQWAVDLLFSNETVLRYSPTAK